MMIKRVSILLICLVAVTLSGCMDPEKIEVRDLAGVSIESISATGLDAVARVRIVNGNAKSIKIKSLEANLGLDDRTLAVLRLRDEVVLPGRFDGVLEVPVNIRIGSLGLAEVAMIASSSGVYSVVGQVRYSVAGVALSNRFSERMTAQQVRKLLNM